jgi:hypothetical protein
VSDLQSLYNALMALASTNSTHAAAYGAGEILGPGVYDQGAAASVAGTLTLNAGGNPNALFVFRCVGALTTSAGASVLLSNGATSNNVWFISQGAASTGAGTTINGSIITNQAAVSTGASTILNGRMLAINGAAGVASSTMQVPTGTSVLPLNSLVSFSVFCGVGSPSNSGVSTIALSVGTNAGTITGFGTATVAGEIYPAGTALSQLSYGIYANGVLLSDSIRPQSQLTAIKGWPVATQTIVTVAAGQTIDVRATAILGTFAIGPGMALVMLPTN